MKTVKVVKTQTTLSVNINRKDLLTLERSTCTNVSSAEKLKGCFPLQVGQGNRK